MQHPLDESLRLTGHCVDRYRQRLAPQLRLGAARAQLKDLLHSRGQRADSAPEWLRLSATMSGVPQTYVVVDDLLAIPCRVDDVAPQRLVGLTCLGAGWEPPEELSARALDWAGHRVRARAVQSWLALSPTAVRRYCQRHQPQRSGRGDLLELAWAGRVRFRPPPWAWRLAQRDITALYLDCGSIWMPLGQAPDGERLLALNCLFADWEATERQRGR